MPTETALSINVLRREALLFSALLFAGIVILPAAIYWVGNLVFGEYGGGTYGQFFSLLALKIRAGDSVAWFLVLAPYLGIQCLRLLAYAWRAVGKTG